MWSNSYKELCERATESSAATERKAGVEVTVLYGPGRT